MTGTIVKRQKMDMTTFEMVDAPVYLIDGKEVTEAEFLAAFPDKPVGDFGVGSLHSGWPMRSEGVAVHPNQREQADQHAASHGVPTRHDRLGRPIFNSLRHQRAYLRTLGTRKGEYHNNDDNS